MSDKKGLTSRQKGLIGLGIMLVLAAFTIWGSDPLYKAISGIGRPKSDVPIYNPGTYTATANGYGGPITVTIEVSDVEIKDVKITGEEETPDIGGKAIDQLPNIIYGKQTDSFDAVSGATVTSNGVKTALKEAMIGAALEGTSLAQMGEEAREIEKAQEEMPEIADLLKGKNDGGYEYTDPEFDSSGYKNHIAVTVSDETITELVWDCFDREGKSKRQLSLDGQYDMTEDGLKWHQQADQLQAYVVENQTTKDLADESGYVALDAVSSVSINVSGFIYGVKQALMAE